MIEKRLKILNELGLHARPASMISQTCSAFKCTIKMIKDNYEINPKSIMGVLTLAAKKDSVIIVITDGEDEKEAMDAIEKLFNSKFDEE